MNMKNNLKTIMRPEKSEKGLRDLCKDLKVILGETPTIVELGSYMGESAVIFSQEFPKSRIICIDAWEGGFDNMDSASHSNYTEVESQFDLRVSLYPNIEKIKGYSTDFSIECDMVYIDACHKYQCVIDDIKHWQPLTKQVISGHDYVDDEMCKIHPHIAGVKVAVNELLGEPDKTYVDGSWFKLK
jgi:cephalosporin hydroxylase